MKLTNRQKEVLSAINELTSKNGYSPALREIKEYLRYNSISAVQRHTDALKKKGFLTSDKYQQRSLKVRKIFQKKHNIPLVGTVACGEPILAIENIEAYIPYEIKGNPKEYFFLRAIGDSMNMSKTKIDDGDLVLIKKQPIADSGDEVVALIGDEATIKVFKQENGRISLEPKSTNPIHKPLYIFEDLQIQGRVVGKIKDTN